MRAVTATVDARSYIMYTSAQFLRLTSTEEESEWKRRP